MKRFTIIGLLAVLVMVGFAGSVVAQVPDCSGEGQNLVGVVWSNGEFSMDPPGGSVSGTLYLFNPSGGSVEGFEMTLDTSSAADLFISSATLSAPGLNAGGGATFIVAYTNPVFPDQTGAVPLVHFQFTMTSTLAKEFYGIPVPSPSMPGNMALLTGGNQIPVAMYPIGGAGQPIANLYGPTLEYCGIGANQPPETTQDQEFTDEDVPFTINIVANDNDPDGTLDLSSVLFVTTPTGGGNFHYNGDGTVDYTPFPDFYGEDEVWYTIADNEGAVSTPTLIRVIVSSVDDPPTVTNIPNQTEPEGTEFAPINLDDYVSDPESLDSDISWSFSGNTELLVDITNRVAYVLWPDENWNGTETIIFTATDESTPPLSDSNPVTFTSTPVNDPPVVIDIPDQTVVEGNLFAQIWLDDFVSDLESEDYDLYWSFEGNTDLAVDINNDTRIATITAPDLDWNGSETITFTASDGLFIGDPLSDSDDATFEVTGVNDPPVAVPDIDFTRQDETVFITIASNDYDIDSPLDYSSIVLGTTTNGGNVWINGIGVNFEPAPGFVGIDSFTYTIADEEGAISNVATVTVTVSPPPQPIAPPDCSSIGQNQVGIVWDNGEFSYPDAPSGPEITGAIFIFNPSGGSVEGFELALDFIPVFGSSFVAVSGYDLSHPGTQVPASPGHVITFDNPVFPDASGAVKVIDLRVELGPHSGANFFTELTGSPAIPGELALLTGGDPTPVPLYPMGEGVLPIGSLNGEDLDYCGTSNQPPVGVPDNAQVIAGQSVDMNLWVNDYDPDGSLDPTSIVTTTPLNGGSIVNNGDGTITFTPGLGFTGQDFFDYTIEDDQGAVSAPVTNTVTVEAPVQEPGTYVQDFETLSPSDPACLALDGWLVYFNVFTPEGDYLSSYGFSPAPNNSNPTVSQVVSGQGGPDQGQNQLAFYSDYDSPEHANGNIIEAHVYREWTITPELLDEGTEFTFSFQAKKGDLAGNSEAQAFIRLLDPSAGYAVLYDDRLDLTSTPLSWTDYQMQASLDPSIQGMLLQFGFTSLATNYEASGVFYDNVNFETDQVIVISEYDWIDRTVGANLEFLDNNVGSAWGDYDGDGDEDVYITVALGGPNHLMRNNGDGTFSDLTTPDLAMVEYNNRGAAWGDPDNDGDLDLYVCSNTQDAGVSYNGMFWNDGLGNFTRDESPPLATDVSTYDAQWVDYDGDGFEDLYLATFHGSGDILLKNIDGTTFVDETPANLATPSDTYGSSWADYDLDGDLDLFRSLAEPENSELLRNEGDGVFVDVTATVMPPLSSDIRGSSWSDFDGDGDPDLYLAAYNNPNQLLENQGGVFVDITPPLLADIGPSTGANWFTGSGLIWLNDLAESHVVYVSAGGQASEVTHSALDLPGASQAVSIGDFEQDGVTDLFVTNGQDGTNFIHRNLRYGGLVLAVKLVGTESASRATGAKIEAIVGETIQTQWIRPNGGLHAQGPQVAYFTWPHNIGVTQVDELRVTWPRRQPGGGFNTTVLTNVPVMQYPSAEVLTVTEEINQAPILADLGSGVANVGDLEIRLVLDDFLTDEDTSIDMTWEVDGTDNTNVFWSEGIAYVRTRVPAWFGTNTLTFTCTDSGGLQASADFTVTWTDDFDQVVEIDVDGLQSFYAGTRVTNTGEFDPVRTQLVSSVEPPLQFQNGPDLENYAYVRHMLTGNETFVTSTSMDGAFYDLYYQEYRPLPAGGEFCFRECLYNEDLDDYDCGDDCQYELEPGKFYSLIWDPEGPWANMAIVEESDQVWLRTDTRPVYDAATSVESWSFTMESTNNSNSPIQRTLDFLPSFQETDGIELKLYDASMGVLTDLWLTNNQYTFEIPMYSAEIRSFTLFVGTPGTTGDTDGDGVPDDVDECPGEDASFFDRNGDGCIDPLPSGRHIEFWAENTFPLEYWVHEDGAPGITDYSDIDAVVEGFSAWKEVPGTEIDVTFMDTTNQSVANAFDGINTVTFSDDEYAFPSGVIAVGLSTSYLEADYENGILPGQIIDTDMIFNPQMPLRTDTAGDPDGTHIKSIVVHEAGHMLGLSHSAVQTSTMFYVLPPDTTAASLEDEDRQALFKAYYNSISGISQLEGTVTDGWTGQPVAGAIVFVMEEATGDTVASDFTLPSDGSFHFGGLSNGNYLLAIHPLDGNSAIGYLRPDNINALIRAEADILFEPEYWDAAESSSDDPSVATPVPVVAGSTALANFITNIDTTGPTITQVFPATGATNVPIDAAVLFRCDEEINPGSLVGNFIFAAADVGDFLAGNASLVENGTTLAYVPTVNLEFGTEYVLEVGAGLEDLYGNEMGTDFSMTFTTIEQPPVALANLLPRKSVAGSIIVLNGAGFSGDLDGNQVTYGGAVWPILEASPSQLVVQVPDDAAPSTANVQVQNLDLNIGDPYSNFLSFTVLPPGEEAHGLVTAAVDIHAVPRQVEMAPDGDAVYIATDQGLTVVDVSNSSAPTYEALTLGNGLTALDITPEGDLVYAVSQSDGSLHRVDVTDLTDLGTEILDYRPQGIRIDPSGRRAYVATPFNEIQILNIVESAPNFLDPIGVLTAPAPDLTGAMATDPAGNYLLALTGSGQVLVFDLLTFDLAHQIDALPASIDVVVDPLGERAYVTDEDGQISVISLISWQKLLDIPTGGSLLGADMDPMGTFLYAVNHELDNLDVIDLRSDSPTYRTISARLPQQTNPLDVVVSPDGLYAYCITETDQSLAINTVGSGPLVASLSRTSGPIGAKVVLAGLDFAGASVSFGGIPAPVEHGTENALVVSVPDGAVTGSVMVLGGEPGEISNAIEYAVLETTAAGNLRPAGSYQFASINGLTGVQAWSGNGRVLALGAADGSIQFMDTDPNSMGYNSLIGATPATGFGVAALVMAPDGLSVFAIHDSQPEVTHWNAHPGSASFTGQLGTVTLDGVQPTSLAISPDGTLLVVVDPVTQTGAVIDWANGSTWPVGLPGATSGLAFHPAGSFAYLGLSSEVGVLDLRTGTAGFASLVTSVPVSGNPTAVAFHPSGASCWILTEPVTGAGDRQLITLGTSDPALPVNSGSLTIPATTAGTFDRLVVSPVGDRLLAHLSGDGAFLVDPGDGLVTPQTGLVDGSSAVGFAFAPDAARVVSTESAGGQVSLFDFQTQLQMAKVWGDGQTGQINQPLSSSLRIRVTDPATGEGVAGVPVNFSVDTSVIPVAETPLQGMKPQPLPRFTAVKEANHIVLNKGKPSGNKDGGESIADAEPIAGLPFLDDGNTAGNTDDFDESCPFNAPGSPDVVYSWVPDFSGGARIDLCGSSYDTKVYVYLNEVTPGLPWACNDNAYFSPDGCGEYVSLIEDMSVFAGQTYYIIIDGYGGESGDYQLEITQNYESPAWGHFVMDDPDAKPTEVTAGTDDLGFVEAEWSLGVIPGIQSVNVSAFDTQGSPLQFSATALADLSAIPFELVTSRFAPQAGQDDVAVTTAIQVVFSKPYYPSTVIPENFYLSADGGTTPVEAILGLAGDNTTASLTPVAVLDYATEYTVVIGDGISSADYQTLTNPQSFTFTTEAAPSAPTLLAANPPSAAELATVMLTGSGFSPVLDLNQVEFGGVPAAVLSAEPDFILTRVPLGAPSGPIQVQVFVNGTWTEGVDFFVLEPTIDGADEVVVRVPTQSGTKSATVTPDGALVYAVAPESDLVIPIDMVNFSTLPSIPVGDMPWAIDMHPDGNYVYVANRASGDVSVIEIGDPNSPTYNQTVESIPVGVAPVDILVTPAGDRVLVANEESQDLDVIDGDPGSAAFNSVVNRVPIQSSAKTVTVTPDGARIYVGTDEGYVVIGSVDYGVVKRVDTGSSVRTVTVTPDGALLVLVQTNGELLVFDIAEGSPTEDQVVARVPATSSVKSATVSPDGARLYAVMEEGDLVNVYAMGVEGSVGALDEYDGPPPFELVFIESLTPGENPYQVLFDPSGSGRFFVPNAGDNTVTVYGEPITGVVSGLVFADCPEPGTPLPGVELDVFSNETSELVSTIMTDMAGAYVETLPAGGYHITIVTPLGYTLMDEEVGFVLESGGEFQLDWSLYCEQVIPDQRKMSFWKHQLGVALRGHGNYEIDGTTLCSYLDEIEGHFNNNALNEVAVYDPPESGECMDKLQVAKDLMNLDGDQDMEAHAKQELLALLFNVASGKLSLRAQISSDGANVSRAVTYVDNCIDDGDPANDETAMKIAKNINKGKPVAPGLIPEITPDIFYSPVATHFHLDQNYPNPFNPECRIKFGVPKPGRVSLKIFDVSGKLVHTLVSENLAVGTYVKVWDGTDNRGLPAASGVYFYRMVADDFVQTRKMLLMK